VPVTLIPAKVAVLGLNISDWRFVRDANTFTRRRRKPVRAAISTLVNDRCVPRAVVGEQNVGIGRRHHDVVEVAGQRATVFGVDFGDALVALHKSLAAIAALENATRLACRSPSPVV
jgi:hypothetical protein